MKMSRPAMRRLIQMPDERLLFERQRIEAVGVELDHRGVVHRLEQVLAIGGRGRRRRRRGRGCRRRCVRAARARRQARGQQHAAAPSSASASFASSCVTTLVPLDCGATAAAADYPPNRPASLYAGLGTYGAVPKEIDPVHYLLMYDVVDDYVTRRAPLRAAHIGLAREAVARGELVLGGALNPPEGVVLLFRGDSPAAAEAFAQGRPLRAQRPGQELEGARVDDGGRARCAGEAARRDQLTRRSR